MRPSGVSSDAYRDVPLIVQLDVDSTLINEEVIELLADVAGTREEVAAVTRDAMMGKLDFAQSLIARVATLKRLPQSVITDTVARVTLTNGAQTLVNAVHARGGKVCAVSGGFIQVLEPLAARLGLDYAYANTLEIVDRCLTGRVTGPIIDRESKVATLRRLRDAGDVRATTVAIGDGANDIAMIEEADLGIAFCAKPIVREHADVVIDDRNLAHVIAALPPLTAA